MTFKVAHIFLLLVLLQLVSAVPMRRIHRARVKPTSYLIDDSELLNTAISSWPAYKELHGKVYEENEDHERLANYILQYAKVVELQKQLENEGATYEVGLNAFSDLSEEDLERRNGYLGLEYEPEYNGEYFKKSDNENVPVSFDWRNHSGIVTAVKNQGDCGSCWAFSTTGSLEGMYALMKKGSLVSLSESNLVDCSLSYGNLGCNGGLMTQPFSYIKDNKGIDTEQSYSYAPRDRPCRFNNATIGADDTGYVKIPNGDETALKEAVATIGPIAVAIDAGSPSFHTYKSGVYVDTECTSLALSHAVLVVGYGTDGTRTAHPRPYDLRQLTPAKWTAHPLFGGELSNSGGEPSQATRGVSCRRTVPTKQPATIGFWGRSWGEDGYIRMARNRDNMCGIATAALYPVDKSTAITSTGSSHSSVEDIKIIEDEELSFEYDSE